MGNKTAAKSPALIPQPHGGALYAGGVIGNAGGGRRPPSELRERLRGSFAERVPVLEEIADREDLAPGERIRALDLMARYGLGGPGSLTADSVRDKLRGTLAAIRCHVPEPHCQTLITEMRRIWLDE